MTRRTRAAGVKDDDDDDDDNDDDDDSDEDCGKLRFCFFKGMDTFIANLVLALRKQKIFLIAVSPLPLGKIPRMDTSLKMMPGAHFCLVWI